ncbi:MAG: AAA family ATPase [Deltaproteobacteria bacterium]|nr:AAA family ATPase [Deltaproteobacteria bacterium]
MELAQILGALSAPDAYPHPVGTVEVRHTHISAVFLAGPYAYKVKKPVDLAFLDFTTLEKRRHFCLEEVRLNHRLAPRVYLGVVPISLTEGALRIDTPGEVVEWAVWMERLPDEAALGRLVERGAADGELLGEIGRRIAQFHSHAQAGPHVARFGRFPVVARNARENFEQSAVQVGTTVSSEVFGRAGRATNEALERLHDLIEVRALRGVPRDTHGDLHLDHIYSFPERPRPDDLAIVDCVEFNERFRYADPVADAAFLAMDLQFVGRPELGRAFTDAYFEAADDPEGQRLLAFYVSYRAAVRAKVEGFKASEPEVPETARQLALQRSRAHWLLALSALEARDRKPCLVLVGGLPGTGKSTLARNLAEKGGFELVSSDAVRKELAGIPRGESAAAAFGEGIYTSEWNDRTYAECRRRAERAIYLGRRVIVDASFREEARRRQFLELARRWAVPGLLLLRTAGSEAVRERLARRKGDASDADWAVYLRAAEAWEPPGSEALAAIREVPAAADKLQAMDEGLAVLRAEGLAS